MRLCSKKNDTIYKKDIKNVYLQVCIWCEEIISGYGSGVMNGFDFSLSLFDYEVNNVFWFFGFLVVLCCMNAFQMYVEFYLHWYQRFSVRNTNCGSAARLRRVKIQSAWVFVRGVVRVVEVYTIAQFNFWMVLVIIVAEPLSTFLWMSFHFPRNANFKFVDGFEDDDEVEEPQRVAWIPLADVEESMFLRERPRCDRVGRDRVGRVDVDAEVAKLLMF